MGRTSSPKRCVISTILALTVLTVVAIWVSPALAVPGAVTGLGSSTHPDESTWYSSNSPSFAWDPTVADGSAIAGYSFVLDQNQNTVPNTTSGSNPLSFLPQVTYTVGSRPAEARIADLNGDGKLDLVVENYGSDTVSVLPGNGDGTFAPKVDYATGAGPWSMAIGDVNGDGKIDVVTGNYAASSASVLINRGDGTFAPKVEYTTGAGSNPECLRMGDVNGDGKLDIFTSNAGTNNISVLLNHGDGTFGAPTTFSTPAHPTSIDLCDLNGDGKQDLATANYSAGSVSVLMGNGDGTFRPAVNYVVSGNPQMVLAADLDRNGKPDLATVDWGTNTASILLNHGDGTYAAKVDYAIGNGPYAFSVTDLNQDGAPDLVTTNYSANSVSVLYGNGDGTFAPKIDLATGNGPCFVALGDLNGDGYGDLIATNLGDGTVSVLIGTEYFRVATSTLAASFTGKGDGTWYFHVRAVNEAGEGGPTTTRAVRIDTTAPTTGDVSTPALAGDGGGAWRTTSQTVSLAAADSDGSGLAQTYYTLDGVQHPYTEPFEVSGDGSHALTYWSTDTAGNAETPHTGWVNIDSGAPVSSDASSPTLALDAVSGWQNTAQLVTLSAADVGPAPVSGLAGIEYDLDEAGYVPYVAPFVVSGEGSHTLLYRAVDRAGNVEVAHAAFVNIDTIAPTVTSSADADTSWHSGDVDVTLTTDDGGGSGIDRAQYRAGASGTWTDASGDSFTFSAAGENGPVTYEYKAIDKAGNETARSCTLNFDTTAPATSDSSTPALAGDGDGAWRTTSQTVSLAAADSGGSGLAQTYYTLDGVQHPYTEPFEVSGDGSHAITYWSTDTAGNAETPHTGWVNIWASPPVTSANAAVSDSADGGWLTSDPQRVTLSAAGGHGTATIHYQVDGDDQVDVEGTDASVTVSGEGSHEITYSSTDSLGNAESQHTGYVNIDTTPPVTGSTYAGGGAWQPGPVSFSLTPTDSGSGMASGSAGTTYQVDGGAPQSGTDVVVESDGEHTVTYSSIDAAGNVESVQTVTVRIDASAPVTGDDAPTAWQNTDTTVTLTPTDLFSGMTGGLAGTTFELDGSATQDGTSVRVAAPADHSNDGAHVITYRSTDTVGNLEADKTATVLVDTLPPVTRDDIAAGPPAHTDPVTVTLSPSDDNGALDVSGVAATHYRVDDGAWQTGTSVQVTGDGQHTVSYYSTDIAGNDEAVKELPDVDDRHDSSRRQHRRCPGRLGRPRCDPHDHTRRARRAHDLRGRWRRHADRYQCGHRSTRDPRQRRRAPDHLPVLDYRRCRRGHEDGRRAHRHHGAADERQRAGRLAARAGDAHARRRRRLVGRRLDHLRDRWGRTATGHECRGERRRHAQRQLLLDRQRRERRGHRISHRADRRFRAAGDVPAGRSVVQDEIGDSSLHGDRRGIGSARHRLSPRSGPLEEWQQHPHQGSWASRRQLPGHGRERQRQCGDELRDRHRQAPAHRDALSRLNRHAQRPAHPALPNHGSQAELRPRSRGQGRCHKQPRQGGRDNHQGRHSRAHERQRQVCRDAQVEARQLPLPRVRGGHRRQRADEGDRRQAQGKVGAARRSTMWRPPTSTRDQCRRRRPPRCGRSRARHQGRRHP